MKKKNLMFGAAILGGIGLAGWMGYRTFKKELKKGSEKEEEKQNETVVEDEEEQEEEAPKFLKPADFIVDLAVRSQREVGDDDTFDVKQSLAQGAHTIHVKVMNKSLDFMLQVPIGVTGIPPVRDFAIALRKATEVTWKNYVKVTARPPHGQFEAWMILNWTDDNGVRQSGMVRVPEKARNLFRKTIDGAIVDENPAFVEQRCVERLNKGETIELNGRGMRDIVLVRALLLYRISYYIGNAKYTGINLETATGCLDYLLNEFSVESREAAEFIYEHIVFYNSEWPNIRVWSFEAKEDGYRMIDSPVMYPEK